MTRTPTAAEIETLRSVVEAFEPVSFEQAKKQEDSSAILDRLSPAPAPEVDEATVWTRKLFLLQYPDLSKEVNGGKRDDNPSFVRVRQVLSELIASKDAERDALGAEVDQLAMYLEDRDSELAAVSAAIGTTEFMDPPDGGSPTLAEQVGRMRAEIERLRGLRYGDLEADAKDYRAACEAAEAQTERACSELDITNADRVALWIERNTIPDEPMNQCASWLACRIVEAHESETAALRAESARFRETLGTLAAGYYPPTKIGEKITAEHWREVARAMRDDAKKALKAAERNTAEPATDTTPEVVVTKDAAASVQIYADCHSEDGSFNVICAERLAAEFDKVRTEAEARGRREALDAAMARLEWYRQYGAGMIDQRGFAASLIVELKRLMTEVK